MDALLISDLSVPAAMPRISEAVSEEWLAPLAAFPLSAMTCRRVARASFPACLAQMDAVLSAGEREHWMEMRAVSKRRQEWLLGRYAAKDAVRLLIARHIGVQLPPAEIEIVPDPYGRPLAAGSWQRHMRIRPAISITHSQGTAVALASLAAGEEVGIDLECLDQRRENFETIAFSVDERALLAALPPEWSLRLWCAKEALAKALGRGFSAGIQAFHITRAESAGGIVQMELRAAALQQFPRLAGQTMIAHTAREADYVFSVAIYRQGAVT